MTTHYTPEAKTWYPTVASDAGNLFAVRGGLAATHGLTLANGDVLEMVKLPKGAIIIDAILILGGEITATAIDIGENGGDELWDGKDFSGGAAINRADNAADLPHTMTADNPITAKFVTGDPADNVKIELIVFYLLP